MAYKINSSTAKLAELIYENCCSKCIHLDDEKKCIVEGCEFSERKKENKTSQIYDGGDIR